MDKITEYHDHAIQSDALLSTVWVKDTKIKELQEKLNALKKDNIQVKNGNCVLKKRLDNIIREKENEFKEMKNTIEDLRLKLLNSEGNRSSKLKSIGIQTTFEVLQDICIKREPKTRRKGNIKDESDTRLPNQDMIKLNEVDLSKDTKKNLPNNDVIEDLLKSEQVIDESCSFLSKSAEEEILKDLEDNILPNLETLNETCLPPLTSPVKSEKESLIRNDIFQSLEIRNGKLKEDFEKPIATEKSEFKEISEDCNDFQIFVALQEMTAVPDLMKPISDILIGKTKRRSTASMSTQTINALSTKISKFSRKTQTCKVSKSDCGTQTLPWIERQKKDQAKLSFGAALDVIKKSGMHIEIKNGLLIKYIKPEISFEAKMYQQLTDYIDKKLTSRNRLLLARQRRKLQAEQFHSDSDSSRLTGVNATLSKSSGFESGCIQSDNDFEVEDDLNTLFSNDFHEFVNERISASLSRDYHYSNDIISEQNFDSSEIPFSNTNNLNFRNRNTIELISPIKDQTYASSGKSLPKTTNLNYKSAEEEFVSPIKTLVKDIINEEVCSKKKSLSSKLSSKIKPIGRKQTLKLVPIKNIPSAENLQSKILDETMKLKSRLFGDLSDDSYDESSVTSEKPDLSTIKSIRLKTGLDRSTKRRKIELQPNEFTGKCNSNSENMDIDKNVIDTLRRNRSSEKFCPKTLKNSITTSDRNQNLDNTKEALSSSALINTICRNGSKNNLETPETDLINDCLNFKNPFHNQKTNKLLSSMKNTCKYDNQFLMSKKDCKSQKLIPENISKAFENIRIDIPEIIKSHENVKYTCTKNIPTEAATTIETYGNITNLLKLTENTFAEAVNNKTPDNICILHQFTENKNERLSSDNPKIEDAWKNETTQNITEQIATVDPSDNIRNPSQFSENNTEILSKDNLKSESFWENESTRNISGEIAKIETSDNISNLPQLIVNNTKDIFSDPQSENTLKNESTKNIPNEEIIETPNNVSDLPQFGESVESKSEKISNNIESGSITETPKISKLSQFTESVENNISNSSEIISKNLNQDIEILQNYGSLNNLSEKVVPIDTILFEQKSELVKDNSVGVVSIPEVSTLIETSTIVKKYMPDICDFKEYIKSESNDEMSVCSDLIIDTGLENEFTMEENFSLGTSDTSPNPNFEKSKEREFELASNVTISTTNDNSSCKSVISINRNKFLKDKSSTTLAVKRKSVELDNSYGIKTRSQTGRKGTLDMKRCENNCFEANDEMSVPSDLIINTSLENEAKLCSLKTCDISPNSKFVNTKESNANTSNNSTCNLDISTNESHLVYNKSKSSIIHVPKKNYVDLDIPYSINTRSKTAKPIFTNQEIDWSFKTSEVTNFFYYESPEISFGTFKEFMILLRRYRFAKEYFKTICERLVNVKRKAFIFFTLRFLFDEEDEDEERDNLRIPVTHKILIGVIIHLDGSIFSNLKEEFMLVCEKILLRRKLSYSQIYQVVMIFIPLCMLTNDRSRARRLILNGLFFLEEGALHLALHILKLWANLFLKEEGNWKDHPLIKLLLQKTYTQKCTNLGALKELKDVLYYQFKYQRERYNENDLIKQFINQYTATGDILYETCILVLCKMYTPQWTSNQIDAINKIISGISDNITINNLSGLVSKIKQLL